MKNKNLDSTVKMAGLGLLAGILTPASAWACACGCGVFDVATSSMLPEGPGGMAFLQYDYQDQNQNWNGTSTAPAANNDDRKIETQFLTVGLQYMFNRDWGVQLEIPYDFRNYKGVDDSGNPVNRRWDSLGDIRLTGIFTGFSDDLSSGLTFGVKLPSGSDNRDADVIDRDTQLGTGSTDLLLGGFHRGSLGNSQWSWFGQAEFDLPVVKGGDYRPGLEVDGAAGVYYNGLSLRGVKISPLAQVIGSWRGRDNGADADPDNTGYQRIMLSPGLELDRHPFRFYADAEFPVYQNFTGNQLAARVLFKVSVSYMF